MIPAVRYLLALVLMSTGIDARADVPAPGSAAGPVTILVSIDGMRPDYLNRGLTPTLSALAAGGVRAAMRPAFPTKTYPNHVTLVTGLVPDRHGIIGNKMRAAERPGMLFTMENSRDPFWWREAEPVWAAAERAGIRTASIFWPGTEPGYEGVHPQDWWRFDENTLYRQRVDAVIDWLRRPPAQRPRFVMLYFDLVDHEGHKHGTRSPELAQALRDADAAVTRLRDGLATLGLAANLVIVSDHGMIDTPADHVLLMPDIADPADWRETEDGPYIGLDPMPGHEAALVAALSRPHPHLRCWPRAKIPARLHYGRNPRVPAWICLADPGWLVLARARTVDAANHGYDYDVPEMRAIFIANGPAFRAGRRLPDFDDVDIEPLLRDLLGLPQGKDRDGTDAVFRGVLRR